MVSDKEKDMMEDEEIIDLTDVIEEGLDPEFRKDAQQDPDDSDQEADLEEDLSDLFDSLSSDSESDGSDSDDFEGLFEDAAGKSGKPGQSEKQQDDDDFLKDFLGDDQEDDPDQQVGREMDDESTDIDELLSELNDSTYPDEAEADIKKDQPDGQAPEHEDEMSGDQMQSDGAEPEEESKGIEESAPEGQTETDPGVSDESEPQLTGPVQDEARMSEKQEQPDATALLAEQLESLSERMDVFEERINRMEDDFSRKAIEAVEEQGPDLVFLNNKLQEIKQDFNSSIEESLKSFDPFKSTSSEDFKSMVLEAVEEKGPELNFLKEQTENIIDEVRTRLETEISEKLKAVEKQETITPTDIKEKALEAIEEKGLELSLVSELTDRINQQTKKLIEDIISEKLQSLETLDDPDLGQKLRDLELRLGDISMPDTEALKQDMRAELEGIIEEKMLDLSRKSESEQKPVPVQAHDLEELKKEMNGAVEDRVNTLIESWQNEKKSLASELENALKFWGKMQEKLTLLSQDIGELKDKRAEIDPELLERFESVHEMSVTREDLKNLASQLKVELEEYIVKKVPEAAARVIREEIAAIVGENN